MFTLAFDTTTNFCSIVLLEDAAQKDMFEAQMDFGQSEVLIPQIQNLLERNRLNFQELGVLAVCTGPGSFTGVRSSVAAARAFGLANKNLNLCGISSFEAYAAAVDIKKRSDVIAVLIETKREDFYTAYFDSNLKRIAVPKTAFFEDIIQDLQAKNITFTGDGVERFLSKQTGLHVHDIVFASRPPIEQIAQIAFDRFKSQRLDFPKPLYLKAADVCAK